MYLALLRDQCRLLWHCPAKRWAQAEGWELTETAYGFYRRSYRGNGKGCSHQFTVTSGTIFASRKMPVRDYLLAIAIFVNGAKGHSAMQLSRDHAEQKEKRELVADNRVTSYLTARLFAGLGFTWAASTTITPGPVVGAPGGWRWMPMLLTDTAAPG